MRESYKPFSIIFIIFTLSLSTPILAKSEHKVGGSLLQNSHQHSAVGTSIYYQWEFADAFELDTGYIFSNPLSVEHNDEKVIGEFDHLYLGINYIKDINTKWGVKAGTGFGFVSNSSNDTFIHGESIAPYIKASVHYGITQSIGLEVGGNSFFQGDLIGTNHSLFVGLNYKFGTKVKYKKVDRPNVEIKCWVAQYGAYHGDIFSREKAEEAVQKQYSKLPIKIFTIEKPVKHYVIVSRLFDNSSDAKVKMLAIEKKFNITGDIIELDVTLPQGMVCSDVKGN